MTSKNFSLIYLNEMGEECQADFNIHTYHGLLELLLDKYAEE
jgi:hypothetical protein